MATGPELGLDCKLYYNSNTYASPTLVEVTQAVDVSFSIEKGYGDVSARSSAWKKQRAALKECSCSFGYRYKAGVTDSVFDFLRAAAIANTAVELFLLDGSSGTTGSEGLRVYVDLKFDEDQPLEDGVLVNFEGQHVYQETSGTVHDPSWYTVP